MVDIYFLICYLLNIELLLNNGLFDRIVYFFKVLFLLSLDKYYWFNIGEIIVFVIGFVIVIIVCMYVVLMVWKDRRYENR